MGAGELNDWARYYATEPFGFPREEARFGALASNILAASEKKWRSSNVLTPSHWMYQIKDELSDDESLDLMRAQTPHAKTLKRVRSHAFEDS